MIRHDLPSPFIQQLCRLLDCTAIQETHLLIPIRPQQRLEPNRLQMDNNIHREASKYDYMLVCVRASTWRRSLPHLSTKLSHIITFPTLLQDTQYFNVGVILEGGTVDFSFKNVYFHSYIHNIYLVLYSDIFSCWCKKCDLTNDQHQQFFKKWCWTVKNVMITISD